MAATNSLNQDKKVTAAGDINAPLASGDTAQNNAVDGTVVRGGGQSSTTNVTLDKSVTDSRNTGQQFGNLGAGASVNVTTSDPAVVLASLAAQSEANRFALASNVATAQEALAANTANTAGAFDLVKGAYDSGANTSAAALSVSQSATAGALGLGGEAIAANLDAARAALTNNLAAQNSALDTVNKATAQAFDFSGGAIDLARALQERNQQVTSQVINSATDQARESAARSQSVVESAIQKLAEQRAPDGANITRLALYLGMALAGVFALRVFFGRARS